MKPTRKHMPAAEQAHHRRVTAARSLRAVSDGARDLLLPPRCVGCGDLLPPFLRTDTVFCAICRTAWEAACAETNGQDGATEHNHLVYLVSYRSGRTDGVPERLIYHLKHQGEKRTFRFVAKGLAPRVTEAIELTRSRGAAGDYPVLFTYPPRRRAAVNEDGFDQAARLAKALAEACGGEFAPLLRRTLRPTDEQKHLDASSRQANAARSYALTAKAADAVRGRTVVLCDDLCTTGATLGFCAGLLSDAGAEAVILATVARTEEKKHGKTDEK